MYRVLAGVLSLLITANTGGCSAAPWIHVFNNTGEAIVVRVGTTDYVAAPQREIQFLYEGETIALRRDHTDTTYRIELVPAEFIRAGWFRGHITFQAERDLRIFLIQPADHVPVDAASYPQPQSYPLSPL